MKICFIPATIALIFMGCSDITIKSVAEKEPIQVDGLAYDWEKYPVVFNEEWHMVYGAVNNDSTLFLQFSFNDPQLARMMARRGIILWFGATKKFGLKYAEPFPVTDFKNFRRDEMYIPKRTFSVVGEDTIVVPDLSQYKPLSAKFGLDKGLYCMEYSVPLNRNANPDFLNSIFSSKYQFVFQLSGLSEEEREEMDQAREERRSRGERGNPGGMEGRRSGRMQRGGPAAQLRDKDSREIAFEVTINK